MDAPQDQPTEDETVSVNEPMQEPVMTHPDYNLPNAMEIPLPNSPENNTVTGNEPMEVLLNAPSTKEDHQEKPVDAEAETLKKKHAYMDILMKDHMILILHAKRCMKAEKTDPFQDCQFFECKEMKDLLEHISTCVYWRFCPMRHCTSTNYVMQHWNVCNNPYTCRVCAPAWKHFNESDPAGAYNESDPAGAPAQ